MRYLIIMILANILFAAQVEVVADNFFADEKKQISKFSGNVKIIKEKDELKAKELIIKFDKKRQPTLYEANGNVYIKMYINEKTYIVKGEFVSFDPIKQKYLVKKNAYLEEMQTEKKVFGEEIIVNQTNGTYEVKSGKKPVKLIFDIKDTNIKDKIK